MGTYRPGRIARLAAVAVALAVLGACGASGGDDAADDEEATTTSAPAGLADDASYGDLADVCHDGDATVDPSEQGIENGKLNIGVATDRDAQIRPGVNREVWDASVAFADWCNAHGGVGGLQIELVELSGKIFEVEAAMTKACTDVFVMVGGGFVQDDLEFSGKDASDIERCGLLDLPALTVSERKLGAASTIQPNAGSPDVMVTTGLRDYQELYPEQATSATIVYGDLPSLTTHRDNWAATLEELGIEVAGKIPYPPVGVTDWTPLARQVIDSGGTTLIWVGEPGNAVSLLAKLKEQGWTGRAMFETNLYDPLMFASGPDIPEGSIVRIGVHPMEEADTSPAVQRYLATLDEYVPDHKASPLGMTSTSAWLLFVTAANGCIESNGGVLTRACIAEQATAQDDWTGGGLHAPTDPAPGDVAQPGTCNMLLEVKGGEFVRRYPEIGGEGDDDAGFHCPADGKFTLER